MKHLAFREIDGNSSGFYLLIAALLGLIGVGAVAFFMMEHHGHVITGMDNQVVWGMPHIFAIFLILSASGVLNVASIGSVFRKAYYHPLARLSALLSVTLLIGGLSILVLDLGHPDRLVVAMFNNNFSSIFAWNIFLYNGFIVVVLIYLWVMMDRSLQRYYHPMGLIAFTGRFILTTGTGSIFGFLVAREAYDTAIFAPLFIAMSLQLGMAVFILVLIASCIWANRRLGVSFLERPKNLFALFTVAVFYLVTVYFLTNFYITEQRGIAVFMLAYGGVYTFLLWVGYGLIGTLLPIGVLYHPTLGKTLGGVLGAAIGGIVGGFSLLYTLIIGGQAYPLEIFPEMEIVHSGFFDSGIHLYAPSIWEIMLGIGGIGVTGLLTVLGLRVLPFLFLPTALAQVKPEEVD